MTKLSKGLSLDLSYTLTGDIEFLTNFLKCTCAAIVKTETELNYVCLTGSEGVELFLDNLTKNGSRCCLLGSGSGVLFPAVQDKLSGNNRPASPHIPFCTFGKSVPGYVVSLKLVMPHSAHWG